MEHTLWPSFLFPHCPICLASMPYSRTLCSHCVQQLMDEQPRCRLCAIDLEQTDTFICPDCLTKPTLLKDALACGGYTPIRSFLVHSLKYQRHLWAARAMAQVMALRLQNHGGLGYQAILPVPSHRHRVMERGVDHTLAIAKSLSKLMDLPLLKRSLERCRKTQSLTHLTPKQRRQEVKHAFRCSALPYQRLLLLDDVCTTGATAEACIAAIQAQNPETEVTFLCFSRTKKPS